MWREKCALQSAASSEARGILEAGGCELREKERWRRIGEHVCLGEDEGEAIKEHHSIVTEFAIDLVLVAAFNAWQWSTGCKQQDSAEEAGTEPAEAVRRTAEELRSQLERHTVAAEGHIRHENTNT
jgi:hypothetical protein